MRKAVKYPLVGVGSILGFAVLVLGTFLLSPASTKRRVFFFLNGTTDPSELLNLNTSPGERIAYGNDPLQFGELNLPAKGRHFPVAIVVHGGCWVNELPGFPKGATTLELMRPLARDLAERGTATWNIEYRRAGSPGGGWPGTFEDLAVAADKLNAIASTKHLDLGHVIVIGHSAGGQLALWLAARKRLPKTSPIYTPAPLPVAGVLDIDGPPSLEEASTVDDKICGTHVITQLLGGPPATVPDHYSQGSADGLLPIGSKQKILFSGKTEFLSNDRAQWSNLFTSYATRARSAGDSVDVTRLDEAGHFDGINPRSKVWTTILKSIYALQ